MSVFVAVDLVGRFGAVVLAGGQSRRMGRDKATLPFVSTTLIFGLVERLARGLTPIVVADRPRQPPLDLPAGTILVQDQQPDCGPLEGLRVGLLALRGKADVALIVGCDSPWVSPTVGRWLCSLVGGHQAAAVFGDEGHPLLLAAYRVDEVDTIDASLIRTGAGPRHWLQQLHVRRVTLDELRAVDPPLDCLININSPSDYQMAVRRAASAG